MKPKASSAEYFAAAARRLIQHQGRGSQERIAREIGVSASHMSDTLNGRKNWTDELRDLVETEVWFPHGREVMNLLPRSLERAERIYSLAAKEEGFRDFRFFAPPCLLAWAPSIMDNYLAGKLTDGQLYEHAVILCRKTLGRNGI